MVAKINRGTTLYGAVIYNQNKVDEHKAQIIYGNRLVTNITQNTEYITHQTLVSFDNYLLANKNTDKPILHISLNPTTNDTLTAEQFAQIAKEYMDKMGYGNQPYIVYLHKDIDRRHIHIVSTCVDENGNKISDTYEWNRSMKVCRELEEKYNLQRVADKQKEADELFLKKADFNAGDIKHQVSNILKAVFNSYRFQTFGEYSALLSCFNIEAKQVIGEHNGAPYKGIVYSVVDRDGSKKSNPIKSSLIDKKFGHDGIAKRMQHNIRDFQSGKWEPKIKNTIALAMHGSNNSRDKFVKILASQGIGVVLRENEEGRLYGVTFIDHNNKEVYNGSRLGKEFSANKINEFFNTPKNHISVPEESYKQIQRDEIDKEQGIEQAFGVLGFEQNGIDYKEEAFARKLRKKKKRGRSL